MMIRRGALAVGLLAVGLACAAPVQADTGDVEDFLSTIEGLGITDIAPADAVALGQSLCPLLAQRSQNTADIAGKVGEAIGTPLGPATMFTGAAVSFLCPRAMDNITNDLTNGRQLFPLFG